jgi:putative transposase
VAYLCAVKDVYSGRIVGYSMDSRMKSSLAVAALENAVQSRRPAGTVVHSDRGSQFRSRRFVESLRHHGLTGSMGRVGPCADNAAMESFFSLLQKNVLDRQRWLTRQDLRLPSQPGSREPTTAGDGKGGWESSRLSNMKQSTGPRS